MSNIYKQEIQLDKDGDLISPFGISPYRCRNCEYSEIRKGKNTYAICYCNLYEKFVPLDSKKKCFR